MKHFNQAEGITYTVDQLEILLDKNSCNKIGDY